MWRKIKEKPLSGAVLPILKGFFEMRNIKLHNRKIFLQGRREDACFVEDEQNL